MANQITGGTEESGAIGSIDQELRTLGAREEPRAETPGTKDAAAPAKRSEPERVEPPSGEPPIPPGDSNPGDLGPLRREGADESENDGEGGGASGAG